jgi:N-acetyltransferase 10
VRRIQPVPTAPDGSLGAIASGSRAGGELRESTATLADVEPAGALVIKRASGGLSSSMQLRRKLCGARWPWQQHGGRGKSPALGLAIAGELGLGYSNIIVTAPPPENLRTLFEFVFKDLDELGFKEHLDYDLVESTNPAFGKSVVRINKRIEPIDKRYSTSNRSITRV